MFSEKEVAALTVQSAEDPVEGDKPDDDSDSKEAENHEDAEAIVFNLRTLKPYRTGNLSATGCSILIRTLLP
jgi:hypothetical protein